MMDEHAQELAALHALDLLEGEEAAEFARRAAADPELARLAAELGETAAALALAAPRAVPPERLKTALLARVAEPLRPRFRVPAWVPWAAAALFLALCGGLLIERGRLRGEGARLRGERTHLREELSQLREDLSHSQSAEALAQAEREGLRGEVAQLQATNALAQAERERLRGEVAQLRTTDALAQIELRALKAATGQSLRAVAVVAWDPITQRGVFEVQQLPAPAAGKDYQLWAIDPTRSKPVSAGIFQVDANGRGALRFHPEAANLQAINFAVSLEPAGGSPQTTGPLLLVGQ